MADDLGRIRVEVDRPEGGDPPRPSWLARLCHRILWRVSRRYRVRKMCGIPFRFVWVDGEKGT